MRRLILWITFAGIALAQPPVQKIFVLKHADVKQVGDLITAFGVMVKSDGGAHALAVSGPPEAMKAVEESIKVLDVAPQAPPVAHATKSIEIVGYMLLASPQGGAVGVPADLDPVVKQLKSSFPYQGFQLLDSLMLRTRDGSKGSWNVSGSFPNPDKQMAAVKIAYEFQVRGTWFLPSEKSGEVIIDGVHLNLRVPSGTPDHFFLRDVGLSTDVNIREGQKVVVGKTNLDGGDSAFFLVITAKIMD